MFFESEIIREFRDGKTTINLSDKKLSDWMLFGPMRNYVIQKVKRPLQIAIEAGKTVNDIKDVLIQSARRLPPITKKNTDWPNTHILQDKFDYILEHHDNMGRQSLLSSVCKIIKAEYEHDQYYSFFIDLMVYELALELAKGNYKPTFCKFPMEKHWTGKDIPDNETIRQQLREALKED